MAFTLSQLFAEGKGIVMVLINFQPQGTGTPTIGDASTGVQSIVRNSAGNWTVTLSQVYKEFLGFVPGVQLAAAADFDVQCGTYTVGTSSTIPSEGRSTLVVRACTAGTETDIAANANNSITVLAFFRRGGSELK